MHRETEMRGGDLDHDGCCALPHFGAGDADFHAAIRESGDMHLGLEVGFAGAGEARAVPEGGEADAAAEVWVSGVELGVLDFLAFVAGHVECGVHERDTIGSLGWWVGADDLAGGGGLPIAQQVDAAQFARVQTELGCDDIHVPFAGEDGLRRAEAAECAVGDGVGEDGFSIDVYVWAEVRASGVQDAAAEDDWGERDVRAGVHADFDLLRE